MAIPQAIEAEANRGGYLVWANVEYESLAKKIRDRMNQEDAKYDASIGLMPDGTWAIWYRSRWTPRVRSTRTPAHSE